MTHAGLNLADAPPDGYGQLDGPETLTIQRLLPGPIERVWAYLTESDLRRLWLASGDMVLEAGAPFRLVWRNDELTDPPGARPGEFGEELSMESRIIACSPPHELAFTWGDGDVTMTLAAQGGKVLLTVVHRRIAARPSRLMIGAGWHAHLDILGARLAGVTPPAPYWDSWTRLRGEYDRRFP
jgi:uncharacterized protein YndB with AHSA1/START domain